MDSYHKKLLELLKFDTSRYHINKEQYDLCAFYIQDIFKEIGLQVELFDTELGKIIIGKKIENSEYPHVHFNGHYDIVSPSENSFPSYDKNKNIFFGRGCSDMKGGIISIWLALMKAIKMHMKCNLSFSFSPDEETGGQIGSVKLLSLISNFLPLKSLVIIADSSYPDIITSHRGAYWVIVKISLKSTDRFSSSVLSAFEIMCKYSNLFFKKPENIEIVTGGICNTSEAINMWVHTIKFSLDYRFDNPYTVSKVKEWVNINLTKINNQIKEDFSFDYEPLSMENVLEIDPCFCYTDFTNHLNIIKNIIPNVKIEKGKGFYDLKGFRNTEYMNSFVLGPGNITNAHTKEEILDYRNIDDCCTAYLKLIEGVSNGIL
jgi:acetylornithine deacetylase/succinyl-diaminopimelate desuccinylase-like protein